MAAAILSAIAAAKIITDHGNWLANAISDSWHRYKNPGMNRSN